MKEDSEWKTKNITKRKNNRMPQTNKQKKKKKEKQKYMCKNLSREAQNKRIENIILSI